jgi:hypothetical protein
MKHYQSYIIMIWVACAVFFSACSDEYMEKMNTHIIIIYD